MKICLLTVVGLLLVICAGFNIGHTASPADLKAAKAEAESKGFIFETSHDEIVAKAKKERGKMRGHISQEPSTFNAVAAAFKAEYPFVDPHIEELTGTDAMQRFFLQVKAGRAQDRLHGGQAGLLRAVGFAGPEEILCARHVQGR